MQTDPKFLRMMAAAIQQTDGSLAAASAAFEDILLGHRSLPLVWEFFAPVRPVLLNRLYGMAKFQEEQGGAAKEAPHDMPTTARPVSAAPEAPATGSDRDLGAVKRGPGTDISPVVSGSSVPRPSADDPRKTVYVTEYWRRRGAASVQAAIMRVGGAKESPWRWMVNLDGVPVRNLTPRAFLDFCETGPALKAFGRLVMSRYPASGRTRDTVGKWVDENTATDLWDQALLDARMVA